MREFLPEISGYCHRPRVDALLGRAMDCSLVTMVAGPGYGKTLAVAQYVRTMPQRLVWLRLVDLDNDANRFWESFQTSLYREMPQLEEALEGTLFPETTGAFASFLRVFAEAVYSGPQTVLVVDDSERLQAPMVVLFLQGLIGADLENLTILLLSNSRQLPFVTTQPDRGFMMLTTDDLTFTPQEAQALFALGGKPISLVQAQRVVKETGGWPLALNALCTSGLGSPGGGASHHHLAAELFEQGFYQVYPAPIRRLLVGLSLLPGFPLVLVKAHADPEQALDVLALNVFVTYDYESELFTYQRMYREFLARKRDLLDKAEADAVQRDAGVWFLENGYFHEAADCFWACRDYDSFIQTLFAQPRRRTSMQVSNAVLARLRDIPEDYRSAHPHVDFALALYHLSNSEANKAKGILEQVVAALEALPDLEGEERLLLGDTCVTLGDVSILQNRVDGLGHIKRAAELLETGCRVRTRELLLVGNNSVFYLPEAEPGLVRPTVEYIFEFGTYADRVANGSGYGLQWLFASEAAYLTGDMDGSRQHAWAAIQRGKSMKQYDIAANGYWILMRVSFYYGDHAAGRGYLEELSNYLEANEVTELHELRDSAHAWYHFMLGEVEQAESRMAGYLLSGYDMPLTLGRNWLLTANCFMAKGEVERGLALLDELEAQITEIGHWNEMVSLHIMRAQGRLAQNRPAEAVAAFRHACDMLWQNDLRLPVVEYGKEAMSIIEAVRAAGGEGFEMDWLEAVHQDAVSYAKRNMAMRRARDSEAGNGRSAMQLTGREREVLGYLAQGMTREEIAHMMNITVNGVKKHLAKIYNKLGAVNRADAIHIATIGGLLDNEYA